MPNSLKPLEESKIMRYALIGISSAFLIVMILLPLIVVFHEAFTKGFDLYLESFDNPDTVSAIVLTLIATIIVLPFNIIFGIIGAWTIAKFKFKGKSFLLTLIDLPFSVSPVISGLIYVLLLGSQSIFGQWLMDNDIKIIYAVPGIILATLFVTFPFVVRELVPIMESLGNNEEEAGVTLGANTWQIFYYITLPNIKWGLIHGVLLCTARAMGEFGAVSVVSGHIRGETNTIPLHIEVLYNEYNFVSAFAVASILSLLTLLNLLIKKIIELKHAHELNKNNLH